ADDIADLSEVDGGISATGHLARRAFFGFDDARSHAGDGRCAHALAFEHREKLHVELSGEDHLEHIDGVLIRDAPAAHKLGFDAHSFGGFGGLLAAAVYDHDSNADKVEQGDVLDNAFDGVGIIDGFTTNLDHKNLVFE